MGRRQPPRASGLLLLSAAAVACAVVLLLGACTRGDAGDAGSRTPAAALRSGPPEPARIPLEMWSTDLSRRTVGLDELTWAGPIKDGIPALDRPALEPVADVGWLDAFEPVIELVVGGEARAYPLQILIWHEIVNDDVAGSPVAVTFCPLCNTAIVFDRRFDGGVLDFGVTGYLRNADLVMFDRQTESWWQQFSGEAIVGAHAGQRLQQLPARIVAWADFARLHPDGRVLSRETGHERQYGVNPYVGYDRADRPVTREAANADDARLRPRERVVFVSLRGESAAVPLQVFASRESVEIELAGQTVVVERTGSARRVLDDLAIDRSELEATVRVRTVDDGRELPFTTPLWFAVAAFAPDVVVVR